jgi:DNA-binding PadR family transcriptional regulator
LTKTGKKAIIHLEKLMRNSERILKFAILGLLCREPMTGYDLSKEFSHGLLRYWNATHSQIYPELKKLVDEGLVVFNVVMQGKLEKKLYTLTGSGRAEFMDWLTIYEPVEQNAKDVFKLRLYFSDSMSDQELLTQLEAQYKMRLEHAAVRLKKSYEGIDPARLSRTDRGDYLAFELGIYLERAEIAWLERSIALIKESLGAGGA